MTVTPGPAPTATRPAEAPAKWSAVFSLTVCIFALASSEFMPVSLLTPIATDLRISEGLAGQGIAVSGAFAVLTSLTISRLTRGLDRKRILLVLTAVMALSGATIGAAPNLVVYLIGRALIGIVVGGFWSLSAATAMRLVPAGQVTRALALMNGGGATAALLAAPLGSLIGAAVGWRLVFFALVPIAAAALIWQWATLPSMLVATKPTAPRNIFGALLHRGVAVGLAACSLFFMGRFVLFTYIRPFLEQVTQVDAQRLSLALLAIGAAGLVGNAVVGRFLQRSLYGTLSAIAASVAVVAAALLAAGPWYIPVLVLLALWGLLSTAAPVGWWTWVARTMPQNAEGGGGLMVAVIQCSIALGSALGGLLVDRVGFQGSFLASAGVLVVAAVLALLAGRAAPHADPRPADSGSAAVGSN